jgi:hypothetical protein
MATAVVLLPPKEPMLALLVAFTDTLPTPGVAPSLPITAKLPTLALVSPPTSTITTAAPRPP